MWGCVQWTGAGEAWSTTGVGGREARVAPSLGGTYRSPSVFSIPHARMTRGADTGTVQEGVYTTFGNGTVGHGGENLGFGVFVFGNFGEEVCWGAVAFQG